MQILKFLYNNTKGVIQWLLSLILKLLLYGFLLIINIPWSIIKGMFSPHARGMAIGEDVLGNYTGAYLFTLLFLKPQATLKFGQKVVIDNKNYSVTISHVMAKAYYENTLTKIGITFANILLFFKDKAFNI